MAPFSSVYYIGGETLDAVCIESDTQSVSEVVLREDVVKVKWFDSLVLVKHNEFVWLPGRWADIVWNEICADVIIWFVVFLWENPWFMGDLVSFKFTFVPAKAEICLEFWWVTQQGVLVHASVLGPGELVLEGELTDASDEAEAVVVALAEAGSPLALPTLSEEEGIDQLKNQLFFMCRELYVRLPCSSPTDSQVDPFAWKYSIRVNLNPFERKVTITHEHACLGKKAVHTVLYGKEIHAFSSFQRSSGQFQPHLESEIDVAAGSSSRGYWEDYSFLGVQF